MRARDMMMLGMTLALPMRGRQRLVDRVSKADRAIALVVSR